MSDCWFTESGTSGTVTINWVNDSWEVIQPEREGLVKCILKGNEEIPKSGEPQIVEGTASRYVIGMDDDPDYLYLSPADGQSQSPSKKAENTLQNKKNNNSNNKTSSSSSLTALSNISGSGDYVTVEAVVDTVFSVNKDKSNIPDIKGKLTDDSVLNGVIFIVEDGAPHPYLEEGKAFRFRGVKDHYYKKGNEVQVKITHKTDFTELEKNDRSDTSSPSTTSANSQREEQNLTEVEGTGDYIDVEATVKSVHAVNKNKSGTSDIRGRLTDASVSKSVLFVVEDGVKHPYLEEGATFKFSNVQDYYDKGEDKVQVRITSRTNFTKVSDSDASESNYSKKEADVSTRYSDEKYHTQRQENRGSTVSKAKKQARRQGRDPAIDPHFQPDDR